MEETKKVPIFWGRKLNEEEIKAHRLSYATMSAQFDAVLCNNIVDVDEYIFNNVESGDFRSYYIRGEEVDAETYETEREKIEEVIAELEGETYETEEQETIIQNHIKELENELENDFEEFEDDIFQYFIVEANALWVLKRAHELVLYSDKLDVYIWCVKHWGTSWDYVLTSLKVSDDFSHLLD